MDEAIRSRARGLLWGQAVGDALGTTCEFATADELAERYPQGHREVVGGGPFTLKAGQVTDDTELALALARSLVAVGRWQSKEVLAAYRAWAASDPEDIGAATQAAFVRGQPRESSQANGALMRISPLALHGLQMEPLELARLGAADAQLSHPNEVTRAASAVFVATLAEAVRSGSGFTTLRDFARTLARAEPGWDAVAPWLEEATAPLPALDGEKQGWVRFAFTAAFHALHRAEAVGVEEALVELVMRGGDTDTNGAIAAALLGAVHGVEALPKRWREPIRRCRPARPATFVPGDLDALVDALLSSGAGGTGRA